MIVDDFRLNDFEIKTLTTQCPDYVLKFEAVEAGGFILISYTKIDVYSCDNEFCMSINSSAIDHNEFKWVKYDVNKLSQVINESKPCLSLSVNNQAAEQAAWQPDSDG